MATVNAAPEPEDNEPEISDAQRQQDMALVATLSGLQKQLDLTDKQLCARHLDYTAPAWVSIRGGNYAAKDWTKVRAKVEAAIQSITAHLQKLAGAQALVRFQFIDHVVNGIKIARFDERDRFVLVLAAPGAGKTTMQKILRAEPGWGAQMRAMECVETMEASLMPFLTELAKVLEITDLPRVAWKAADKVIEKLKELNCVLFLDELHHGGPSVMNFVKRITNQTACVVVGVAIPELWNKLKRQRAFIEAQQLLFRTAAEVRVERIETEDARRFCEARVKLWNDAAPEVRRDIVELMARCCSSATGMVDAAAYFAKCLNLHSVGQPPTPEAARKAENDLKALRGAGK
jgi:hypothetical protein